METPELSLPRAPRALQLLAAVMLLSWCVSLRLPADTPASAFVLPSADIAVLLAWLALLAPHPGWQLARAWRWSGAALLLGLRLLRVADGVCLRFLDRHFHLTSDVALLPEFARLGLSTLGGARFALALAALIAASALTWRLMSAALRVCAGVLSERRAGDVYLASVAALALLGPLCAPSGTLFAPSVSARVLSELELWLTARGWFDDPARAAQRRLFNTRFAQRQKRLEAAPQPARGGAVDVHLVIVEAYGHTLRDTPAYARLIGPAYREFESAVEAAGFSLCTAFVSATVFGGNSWLTHATLETAVPIGDQFEYSLLLEQNRTATLAKAFHGAGYRSVSVKPGTTRRATTAEFYGFDREYAARDFGYRGPSYGWAPMPDQFVLQRLAERELRHPTQPLFIEYALVSSHFPFNPHPPYVEREDALGDGSIYHSLPPISFATGAGEISAAALGYVSSISYDLRVLGDFVTREVRGDALVLILGDHQPIAPVAGNDRSRATPLHVLSRRDALLQPFRDRGCVQGLFGPATQPQLAMEDLGIELLSALRRTSADRAP